MKNSSELPTTSRTYTVYDLNEMVKGQPQDFERGKISDGYHTFDELYEFRKVYNAALFNILALPSAGYDYNVHKSLKHHDGNLCFGGGWFIVMADLPTGQVSNHYEIKDWDLFKCKAVEAADKWDGHTSEDVLNRLKAL